MPQQRGRTVRDAKSDFFENDAVQNPGQALVREAIQNALDARRGDLPSEEPVRVAFRFVGGRDGGDRDGGDRDGGDRDGGWLLDGLRPHLTAERNGLSERPDVGQRPHWLIVEDEGTVGLTGDPTLDRQPPANRTDEHYYHFVWAEGQTNKGEGARGSHGIGKMVFSLASTVRTTLVHTRRASDGCELIVGRCHLRHHEVGTDYCDNGFFGRRDADSFTHPLDGQAAAALDRVRRATGFGVRRPDRTGLSVAMLWPDPEIRPAAIRQAVCGEWFASILSRRLVVTIECDGQTETIDANSFERLVETIARDAGSDLESLPAVLALARHRQQAAPVRLRHTEATRSRAWKWPDAREQGLLDDAPGLQADYLDGEPIHVRVPVTVPVRKDGVAPADQDREGHFDIVLQKLAADGSKSRRPWFLREGILISDVHGKAKRSSHYRAIVAIDSGPVAAMLRTAENPAHTQWMRPKLGKAYAHGCMTCLEFVQSAAEALHQALVASDREQDVFALADFFGVAGGGLRGRGQEGTKKSPTQDPPRLPKRPVVEATPQPLEIKALVDQDRSGVRITNTPHTAGMILPGQPLTVEVAIAYDVNRGSALDRHSLADFDLRELTKKADPAAPVLGLVAKKRRGSPVNVGRVRANRLRLSIEHPESFEFTLLGFDPLRDLFVRAEVVDGLKIPSPPVGGATDEATGEAVQPASGTAAAVAFGGTSHAVLSAAAGEP